VDRERLAATLVAAANGRTLTGVLSLLAVASRPHPDHPALPTGAALTVALIQALGDLALPAPPWCATTGAGSTHAPPPPTPAATPLPGPGTRLGARHGCRRRPPAPLGRPPRPATGAGRPRPRPAGRGLGRIGRERGRGPTGGTPVRAAGPPSGPRAPDRPPRP